MNRSDYAFHPLSPAQYEAIVTAAEMDGNRSPLHGVGSYVATIRESRAVDADPRVALAWCLWEDHDGTDPGGGLALAAVYNFAGIKWDGQPNAFDSGIPVPPNEQPGTYAGFSDVGAFMSELYRTLTNQFCGPYWHAGELANAASVYITGQPGSASGQSRVDTFLGYLRDYPPEGTVTTVFASAIVGAAKNHLGQTHEFDARNGDHPVSMYCEADIEDWCAEAGAPQPAMPTAAANADRAPLSTHPAPEGALVFFKGPGWSEFGHVGVSLGEGMTISGLESVVVSPGWQDPAVGYVGWRYPDGVVADPVVTTFVQDGNPWGAIAVDTPFWARFNFLETTQAGLGLATMGYAKAAAVTLANGRRVQQFERGWYGTQAAPNPWDCVALMPSEYPK